MFGIEPLEFALIALVALFVFGPDRLPTVAKQAGRWTRDLRRAVANARRDLDQELGMSTAGITMASLDPRGAVQRHLLDGLDDEPVGLGATDASPPTGGVLAAAPDASAGEGHHRSAPFDSEAT